MVILLMAAVGVALIASPSLFNTSDSRSDVLLAVGGSLLATALFSGIHVFFTNIEFLDLLSTKIEEEQQHGTQEMVRYLANADGSYMPSATYDPTDGNSSQFNADLTQSLGASHSYRFHGLTGYFVPMRLAAEQQSVEVLRVSIADPRDHAAIRFRVTQEMARSNPQGYADVVEAIRDKIRQCLVGLFEIRARCQTIEILITAEVSPDRFEIFDDEIYVTLFDPSSPIQREFPSSLRFGRDSVIYEIFRRRFDLQFSRAAKNSVISFLPEDGVPEFLAKVEALDIGLDSHRFEQCRGRFRTESAAFAVELQSLT